MSPADFVNAIKSGLKPNSFKAIYLGLIYAVIRDSALTTADPVSWPRRRSA